MKRDRPATASNGNEPSENRLRAAADIVAKLKRDGISAAVVLPGQLEDFVRDQAAQLLEAARQCEDPELRARMIDMVRSALAKLSKAG
jgi:hypothetical protein